MGMTLPFACRAMIVDDRDIGRGLGLIYGTNTFGAGLGAFATTYLMLPHLGLSAAMLLTVVVNAAAAAAALVASARHERAACPPPDHNRPGRTRDRRPGFRHRRHGASLFVPLRFHRVGGRVDPHLRDSPFGHDRTGSARC